MKPDKEGWLSRKGQRQIAKTRSVCQCVACLRESKRERERKRERVSESILRKTIEKENVNREQD